MGLFLFTFLWGIHVLQLYSQGVGGELVEQEVPKGILPPLHQAPAPVSQSNNS